MHKAGFFAIAVFATNTAHERTSARRGRARCEEQKGNVARIKKEQVYRISYYGFLRSKKARSDLARNKLFCGLADKAQERRWRHTSTRTSDAREWATEGGTGAKKKTAKRRLFFYKRPSAERAIFSARRSENLTAEPLKSLAFCFSFAGEKNIFLRKEKKRAKIKKMRLRAKSHFLAKIRF